jgi:hypothetical protein
MFLERKVIRKYHTQNFEVINSLYPNCKGRTREGRATGSMEDKFFGFGLVQGKVAAGCPRLNVGELCGNGMGVV